MASKHLDEINLLGKPCPNINKNKFPSKRQVLQVFFRLHNEEKKTIWEAASGAIYEALPFWEKTRIPVRLKKTSDQEAGCPLQLMERSQEEQQKNQLCNAKRKKNLRMT